MKIIKRNGAEVTFDISKIMSAVTKANEAVEESVRGAKISDHLVFPKQDEEETAEWRHVTAAWSRKLGLAAGAPST